MPPLKEGDLVAFMTAGAYGATLSSQYNSRPLVAEALVRGDACVVVRRRPTFEEMIALERAPDWIARVADGFGLREKLDARIASARRSLFWPALDPGSLLPAASLVHDLRRLLAVRPLHAPCRPRSQATVGVVFWVGLITTHS